MEFSSVFYFSFCSIASLLFLIPGLHALDKAALPVPDAVMFQFKILLSFSMCTCSSYAFLFRPHLEHAGLNEGHKFQQFYQHLFMVLSPLFFLVHVLSGKLNQSSPWILVISIIGSVRFILSFGITFLLIAVRFYDSKAVGSFWTGFLGPLIIYPNHTLCWILLTNLYFLVGYVKFFSGKYSIFLVFTTHWYISLASVHALSLYQTLNPWFKSLLAASDLMSYIYRKRKAIESMVGLSGILIAQYFTRENSGALVLALACLSISWLANLAMNQPVTDLGIFTFLASGSVECAVNVFGFHVYTWLVFGISLLLIIVRWNIDSFTMHYTGMQEVVMTEWKSLEELHASNFHLAGGCPGPECVFCPDVVIKYFTAERKLRTWNKCSTELKVAFSEPNLFRG